MANGLLPQIQTMSTTTTATPPKPYGDDSVQTQLNGLLKQSNPLMQKAKTEGMQFANRRGLGNSSIAAGATQTAMLDKAVPIASQDAAQIHTKNLQAQQITGQKDIAGMNISAHDREKAMSATAAFENSYGEMFRTIAQAHELPADVRDKYLTHITKIRDSNLNLVEQLYNVDLQWATPSV